MRLRYPLIIILALVQHLVWASALMIDPAAGFVTAIHALVLFLGQTGTVAALTFGSIMSLMALFANSSRSVGWLLIPQQVILCVSGAGAIEAMWLSQFADGVIRPQAFLIADQLPALLFAIGHTVAIFKTVVAPPLVALPEGMMIKILKGEI